MTMHRERNLHIACALEKNGSSAASTLVKIYKCYQFTNQTLRRDYYNWFTKVDKGIYDLSQIGREALDDPRFAEVVAHYRKAVEECITAENQEL